MYTDRQTDTLITILVTILCQNSKRRDVEKKSSCLIDDDERGTKNVEIRGCRESML